MRRALALLAVVGLTHLFGCGEPTRCDTPLGGSLEDARFVVLASDYAASSLLSVLDRDGALLEPALVSSGSRPAELVAPLSGDVSLPRARLVPRGVALIDRFTSDVLTVVDRDTRLVTQADLRGGRGSGAAPNAQDGIVVGDAIWITRQNPAPQAPELARGNDVLVLDAMAPHAIRGRIALDGANTTTGDGEVVFARPGRIARVVYEGDERVVVGLARLTRDFRRAGEGALAVLSATTPPALEVVSLAGLVNCELVAPAPRGVWALCQGPTFSEPEARRSAAGLAHLSLDATGVVIDSLVAASTLDDVPSGGLVVLDDTRVLFVARGTYGPPMRGDRLVMLDVRSASEIILAETDEPFVLGTGAYDAVTDLLLVPDASPLREARDGGDVRVAGRVRRFHLGETPVELGAVSLGACALPPREVALIDD